MTTTGRGAVLGGRLRVVADALIATLEPIDEDRWHHVPEPGVWSIGKDAEHVSEAAVYHQWIVRLTIGEKVSSRRPAIERSSPITSLSPGQAIELIRHRSEDGIRLLTGLTDAQLDLSTRPPRVGTPALAVTIERVLIAHYDAHRADIEAKLRASG